MLRRPKDSFGLRRISMDIDDIPEEDEDAYESEDYAEIEDLVTDLDDDNDGTSKKRLRDNSYPSSEDDERDTFEAEGQLNLALTDHHDSAGGFQKEQDELRGIWKVLGVGKNGYLTISELAQVCYHIGLDEMNTDELQQLFDKLDVDCDGKVGFQEFCHGLFQHNPSVNVCMPPGSVSTTMPRSMSAQKKLKFMSTPNSEDKTTPSFVVESGTSGLFSSIDAASSGFAKPEEVADLWETYSVSHGTEILQALGFDTKTKVNLSELSFVLEQELMNIDDQGAFHQAAMATFKQEIRHLKSTVEQVTWARDKLKLDLGESNTRNTLLAKEVDEEHASMEKIAENKLFSLEKQYQEQICALKTELGNEKENVAAENSQSKQIFEIQVEEVRKEEAELRKKLVQTQKEMEKMESDFAELTEKLEESKRQNVRLEVELRTADELKKKLAEYEAKGTMLSPDEQMFASQKLEKIEEQNKELKDKNDELTTEVEGLKQQAVRRRSLPFQKSIPEQTRIPIPEGTPLSEYLKHTKRRATVSSLDIRSLSKMAWLREFSDDDASTFSSPSRHRRFLPDTPDDDACSVSSAQSDKDHAEQLRRELYELKNNFEQERKEIEHAYKVEIAGIEDKYDQEKAEMLNAFEKEKTKLEEKWERKTQTFMAEQQRELQTNFVHEKQDIIQKCESEKNLMDQKFTDEKQNMLERLNKEYTHDLDKQVLQMKEKYEQELELLKIALREADPTLREQENQIADLENVVRSLKEESQNNKELASKLCNSANVVEALQNENSDLKLELEQERRDWEHVFEQEKDDFKEKTDLYEFTIAQYESSLEEIQQQKDTLEVKVESQKLAEQLARDEGGSGTDLSKERLIEEIAKQRDEFDLQFEQERKKWDESLEQTLTEYSSALNDLSEQNAELQLKLKQKSEPYENDSENNKEELQQQIESLNTEVSAYKEMLRKSSEVLKEELKDDIDKMLEEKEETFEKERTVLCRGFKQKISALEDKHQKMVEEYEIKLEQAEVMKSDRFHETTDVEHVSKEAEESIARVVRQQLEDEFVNQVEQLKESFEDERQTLAEKISLLQEHVEMLETAREIERKNQQPVTELKAQIADLQNEKYQMERTNTELQATLQVTKQSLEGRIDELLADKTDTIVPVQVKSVRTAILTKANEPQYEKMVKENYELETKVKHLQEEVTRFQLQTQEVNNLQTVLQMKTEEVKRLQSNLQLKSKEVERLQTTLQSQSEVVDNLQLGLQRNADEIDDIQKKHEITLEEKLKVHSEAKDELKKQYTDELGQKIELLSEVKLLRSRLEELQPKVRQNDSLEKQYTDELGQKLELLSEVKSLRNRLEDLQPRVRRADSLEKAYESLLKEKSVLESGLNMLKTEVAQLSPHSENLQKAYNTVLEEKSQLESELMALNDAVELMVLESEGIDSMQSSYDSLLKEKSFLQSDLNNLKQELMHFETVAKRADSLQIMNDGLQSDNHKYIETISDLEMQLGENMVTVKEQKVNLEKIEMDKERLQQSMNRSEDRIKNADEKLTEYQQMEVGFSQVKKEKDNLSCLVETLQKDIQSSSTLTEELLKKEKEKVKLFQQEKQSLEKELKVASDKFSQLNQSLRNNQQDHEQELQNLKERTNNRIELSKYVQLQMDLLDQQKKLQEMQNSLEFKDNENSKEIHDIEEVNKTLIDCLEEDKKDLSRKLKLQQSVLDEQVDKLKQQFNESEKCNILVVNLYKENSELMESLYNMDKRKKDAVSRCYKLEDQCNVLRKMLKKVCHVAIS